LAAIPKDALAICLRNVEKKPMNREKLIKSVKRKLITIGKEKASFTIMAVLLFGSRAKGGETKDSDIDLLFVAEGINPKRHRRGAEIAYIKRRIPELSLDILLFTEEETLSNFKNHNPLFLDMAEEGIIIFDKNNFLQTLISETRDYIRQKGIKRYGDGWIFQVEKGTPVYLSKVSNKDFSQAMLKDGQRDFEIGKRLTGDGYYDKAVYHFQQTIEKSTKSILLAMGIFQKTHLVGRVLRKIVSEKEISGKWKTELLEVAEISEEIEPEVSLSRYPGIRDDSLWLPFEEYTKEDADGAMGKAKRVLSIGKVFIKDWFSK
jgi:HEPN domain-containing protein/predicted nucleotidyltransferase